MLQIKFSVCNEDFFEYIGRITYHISKYGDFGDNVSVIPLIIYSTESGKVISLTINTSVTWSKAKIFIGTCLTIARNNDLHVEVVGVSF